MLLLVKQVGHTGLAFVEVRLESLQSHASAWSQSSTGRLIAGDEVLAGLAVEPQSVPSNQTGPKRCRDFEQRD